MYSTISSKINGVKERVEATTISLREKIMHLWIVSGDASGRWVVPGNRAFLRSTETGLYSSGMSRIQFHKIWVQQCRATRGIKRRFGVKSALDYLLGEKLMNFADAAEQHPEFAAELPRFQAAVWNIFNPYELAGYLSSLKPSRRKKLQELLYVDGSSRSRRAR
jgi:hypothetical protein